MTNSLVGDHKVAVVDVDEGGLEGSDMSGTRHNVDDSVGNEIENINFKYFCYRASFMVKKPFTSPDTDTPCYVDR